MGIPMDPNASCWKVSREVMSSSEAWCKIAAVLTLLTLAFIAFLDVVWRVATKSGKVGGQPGSNESSQARSWRKARVHPLELLSVDCIRPCSQAGPWKSMRCARPILLVDMSCGSGRTCVSALTPSLVRLPSCLDLVKSWRWDEW